MRVHSERCEVLKFAVDNGSIIGLERLLCLNSHGGTGSTPLQIPSRSERALLSNSPKWWSDEYFRYHQA